MRTPVLILNCGFQINCFAQSLFVKRAHICSRVKRTEKDVATQIRTHCDNSSKLTRGGGGEGDAS